MERHWILEVKGQDADLNIAANMYAADDPQISKHQDGDRTFFGMTSKQFKSLTQAREVHEIGLRLLGFVNGVLFIHDDQSQPLLLGSVREKAQNGGWNYHLMAETAVFESRFFAPTVTVSGQPAQIPPYVTWTNAANTNDRVAEVLTFLSRGPSWFDLYNAFEIMRADINERFGQQKQVAAGWPEKEKLDFFTESATVYRHSSEKWGRYTPATAMTLKKARDLVRQLATIWLKGLP